MKKYLFIFILSLLSKFSFSQENKGLCGIQVADVSKVVSFGYLVGYTVEFKNVSKKTADGIYWTTYFYNNSGELLKKEESSFNAADLVDPIASGFSKSLARAPRVKGASKAIVKINKVHFSDGSVCN